MVRIALVLLLTAIALPAWQWPTDRLDTLERSGTPDLYSFSFRGGDATGIPVVSPVDGEVVFSGPGFRSVPSTGEATLFGVPALVIHSHGEFRISLWANDLRPLSGTEDSLRTVTEGQPLGTADSLVLSVYDVKRGGHVNPRMLFPFDSRLPEEVLPPVQFLQNGEPVSSDSLRAGTVTLVVPAGELPTARLPRSIQLLRNGVLESYREFVFSESLGEHLDNTGNLRLGDVPVSVGTGALFLEGYRFDGSVIRRRLDYNVVPEPDPLVETDGNDR